MIDDNDILPYAAAVIKLLKGNIFKNDTDIWNYLIQYQPAITEYFSRIGIDLFVNENDGYAFLKQKEFDESSNISLPPLVEKRALSYSVTLLCVLLVEKLIEHDAKGGDSPYLVMDRKEIHNSMKLFRPDISNEKKTIKDIDANINTLKGYGFLRQLRKDENKFEVRKILRAKISAETIQDIKKKVIEYAELVD